MPTQQQPDGPNLTVTDAARAKLIDFFEERGIRGIGAVRVEVQSRGPRGVDYAMTVDEAGTPEPGDAIQDETDFKVFVDPETLPRLRGATVDYISQMMGGGFRIENPGPTWDDPIASGIQRLIDEEINPGVAGHGGHCELIDVKENVVYVQMGGGCQGCAMVDVTLRQGIETIIQRDYPQITAVVDTTDHAGGSNPYYQPSKGATGTSPFYQPAKG